MSFPRYSAYKDCGVEWLGEVPEHWGVAALKRGFAVTLGKMLQPNSDGPDDKFLPYLRAANIQWGGVDTSDVKEMWLSKSDRAQLRLESGDLLVSEGGDVGRSCLWKSELEECYFQNSVNRARARSGNSSRYLCYWMSTIKDKGYIDVVCNKSTIAHFTAEKVASVPVPLPPITEQTNIAVFLDRETAKIDELVAEQRRLVELLKEKRQAVISHAVTKGLNPYAPMKPSGIEWLGDVPAHWDVSPLKYVVNLRSGGTPSKANLEYWDGGVPWASSKDLKVEALSDTQDHITQKAIDDGAADFVPAGSVLIVVRGMILTHTFPVVKALVPMAINQDLKALTPTPKLNADFLAWLLRGASGETLGRIDEAAHGTKVLRLEAWTSIALPIPPLDEQSAIVSGITDGLNNLDSLITEAQSAINLLQERRTALISAAVTGQIDVRGLAKSEAA